MHKRSKQIIKRLIPLIFLLPIFHLPTAQGAKSFLDSLALALEKPEHRQWREAEIAKLNKERAILYGRLKAAGYKREVLDKCSLNELRSHYAYVEHTARSRAQTIGKGKNPELQRADDDRFAFRTALKGDEGKMLKTYIDLGGGDIKHINILMKLDKLEELLK